MEQLTGYPNFGGIRFLDRDKILRELRQINFFIIKGETRG